MSSKILFSLFILLFIISLYFVYKNIGEIKEKNNVEPIELDFSSKEKYSPTNPSVSETILNLDINNF